MSAENRKLRNPVRTILVCILAWAVPGLGHLYLKKWFRGSVFLLSFVAMFWVGLVQDGKIYPLESLDFFATLKFFDNLCMGVIYFWARYSGIGQGNITSFTFEYGNAFLLTAGLLNMLFVVDVFDIVQERKD